ncbi:MAG: alpha/beta hydrolase [Microthrixaceae bacterium]|nr:alpha/beta hydrolase [Microthrixaceae bacterium]MCO5316926.1 alpha/beta hydrolase [Microthrixaceae bacterium]
MTPTASDEAADPGGARAPGAAPAPGAGPVPGDADGQRERTDRGAPWWSPLGALERGAGLVRSTEKRLARQPLARLTTAVPRTARWAAETLRDPVVEPGPGNPLIRLTPGLVGNVAMDESVMALAVGPNRFPGRSDYERVGAELALARDRLERAGYLADPVEYHREPPALRLPATSDGWALGRGYQRISWPSGYEPPLELPGWERWNGFEANRTASAWVLAREDRPRPWLVCVHGFGMGAPFTDQFAFKVKRLHDELGINMAGIVLPAHGSRRPSPISGEQFLNFDLMNAVHGLSQALWDLRGLISWVRGREPTRLGLIGVSLGAYMSALCSAFEDDLDLVVAGIPVVDLVEMFRHHSPRHVHMRALEHHILDETAQDVMSVVAPLGMPVRVPPESRTMFAGLGDRLAPPFQARRLWEHWDDPEICWYPGNHVGYLWASKAWTFVERMLQERDFTE